MALVFKAARPVRGRHFLLRADTRGENSDGLNLDRPLGIDEQAWAAIAGPAVSWRKLWVVPAGR